ncbi:MAG: carbohydrate-binding domain-containing protein, partial [Cellulomonas sp.]
SIAGGDLTLAAGDDGVHADNALQITDGTVDITTSYEGLEAGLLTIAGGDVSVVASDDGVNASDPDASGEQAPGGTASTTVGLAITGGTIVVDSGGDGLDANGFLTMTGGTAVVNGPTNDGNGALDVDGTFDVSGGTILAVGASGMAMTPGADSSQSFVAFTFSSTQAAGTVVHIVDANGNELAAFESSKDFTSLVYASADIEAGATYSAATGGSVSGDTTGGLAAAGDSSGSTVVATGTAGEALAGTGGGGQGGAGGGRPGTRA